MIDGITGLTGLFILAIVVLLCRYSYYLGMKEALKILEREK